jgi:hypothetical protein
MRATTVLASVLVSGLTGCVGGAAPPPKAPEPIVYDRAAFTPPSEFDMTFASQGEVSGPAIKSTQPASASYRARMVSMEKRGEGE